MNLFPHYYKEEFGISLGMDQGEDSVLLLYDLLYFGYFIDLFFDHEYSINFLYCNVEQNVD